ncbi:unnamed protein product, partial [Porites evermanni]
MDQILQGIEKCVCKQDDILVGWPEKCDEEELKPYHIRSQELSCEQSCVFWGSRVIIPQVFREKMLKGLH